jgi:hypothetical protein
MSEIPNTPQFDTGNAILGQLKQINQQINARLEGSPQPAND